MARFPFRGYQNVRNSLLSLTWHPIVTIPANRPTGPPTERASTSEQNQTTLSNTCGSIAHHCSCVICYKHPHIMQKLPHIMGAIVRFSQE
ncbi:MAG: hypothetical protein D8B53_04910 [Corynebacterium sp.]|nr:MAG: hypothetical protein D8B53_04910 [Corynebacterium sp.]